MEFIFLVILMVVVFGPATLAIIAMTQVRGMRRRLEELERFSELRAHRLSDRVHRLECGAGSPVAPPPEAAAPKPAPPPAPPEPKPAPVVIPKPPKRTDVIPYLDSALVDEPVVAKSDLLATPFPPLPPRILRASKPPPVQEPKESVPLESLIGERILPRVGVVAIVLGLGLLVWYSWGKLGPEGKVALTGSTGAAMVVAGVVLRRNSYTQLLGGCLIGGGWAVMYITAYAAHSVTASRVITSDLLGFVVLLAVAQAALIHALRYRSETITGLAYLLTMATLLLSPEPGPAAWGAIGLSAAILVVLARREGWIRLCALGAALLYVAEVVWLYKTPPGGIVPAMGVLAGLWLLWTLPDYFHRPSTEGSRIVHGLLVAINFVGVLIIGALIQRWFHLEYMGWVWFTLGALYAIHAFAGRNAAWRPAHQAALLFAAILLAIAAHQLAAGLGPVFAWMGISAALIVWGLWRKDEIPRVMGIAGLVVSAGRLWTGDWRMEHAWIPALTAAALFYATAAMVAVLKRTGRAGTVELQAATALSHIAAVSLALVLWHHPPELTSGALFALAGLALAAIGPRLGARELTAEGVCYLAIAAFFVAAENLTASGDFLFLSRRLASTLPVLLAWFGARLLLPKVEADGENLGRFFSVMLKAGLLALLGFELGAAQAPVAWGLAGAAWYLWSRSSGREFEFLVAAAGAAATVVAYAVAPTLQVPIAGWSGPVASGAILVAVFVAIHLASLRDTMEPVHSFTRDVIAVAIAVTGFTLMARELSGMWLTGSWAILGFALAVYGFGSRDRVNRWSSLMVLGACLVHVTVFHLPQAAVTWALVSGSWFLWSRLAKRDLESVFAALGAAGGFLAYAMAPALQVPAVGWSGPVASGAILLGIFISIHIASRNARAFLRDVFAAAVAVTGFTLLAREMTGTWLTGSWAVLGFALAAYGFLVRDRVSRWSSLLILGVCIGKVVIFDLAKFEMPVKIATLITLGTVMVALSFVYARHHRRIVVYLAGKE